MAESEFQRPEFEDPDSLNLDPESASSERRGGEDGASFESDVDEMLDSIDVAGSDSGEAESAIDLEEDGNASDPFLKSSADDLLLRAGSILNGGDTEIPALESVEDLELDSSDTDLDGVMSMPDPQILMKEASAVGEEPVTKSPASIAERAGDLSPPPPAPVALEEDEIERELSTVKSEVVEEAEPPKIKDETVAEEPIAEMPDAWLGENEDSAIACKDSTERVSEVLESPVGESNEDGEDLLLDDDGSFLMDDEDKDDPFLSIQENAQIELNQDAVIGSGNSALAASRGAGSSLSENAGSPKFRILKTAMRSLPFAAAVAILGIGLIGSIFKNELLEWVSHGDAEGSSITRTLAKATAEIFDDFGPDSPYRMAWLETEIKRVSDAEFRIEAQIGAELKVDLYQAVDDSIIYSKLPFAWEQLEATAHKLELIGREDLSFPAKRWKRLYKHSASKGEVFPFQVSYRLLKLDAEWELSGMRIKADKEGFAWSRGRPKAFFGAHALDVSSTEFAGAFRAFEKAGLAYLQKATLAEKEYLAAVDQSAKQAQAERQDLIMAMSQGSYFKGMVIAGKEGEDAREVSLVITETRNGGGIIKGVLKLEEEESPTKHFTGFFDVVESEQGIEGQLELTTIAFSGQASLIETPAFFNPGTVSRIKLQTDGSRMEGDADEISLRLIRSL